MVKRRVHGDDAGGAYAFGPGESPLRLRMQSGKIVKQPVTSAGVPLSALIEGLTRTLSMRRHVEALELVRELVALDPDEPLWHQKHGDVLRLLYHEREAAAAYRLAARRYAIQGLAAHASSLHAVADHLEGVPEK